MKFIRLVTISIILCIAAHHAKAQSVPSCFWTPTCFVNAWAAKQDVGRNISLALNGTASTPAISFTNANETGLYLYSDNSTQSFTIGGQDVLQLGNTSNSIFPNYGVVIPFGSLAIRSANMGCDDQGNAETVIVTSSIFSAFAGNSGGPALSVAGPSGDCTNGLSRLATYGTLDSVAQTVSNYNNGPPITLTGITYDATHVYFTGGLTTNELSHLQPWMYVLTNSIDTGGRLYASFLVSATSSSLTVIGWVALGSGNDAPGQIPSNIYLANSGSSAVTWIGQPTALFTRNELCSAETVQVMVVGGRICTEIDVVNNSGVDVPSNKTNTLSGYAIYGMGNNKSGAGLSIAGINGLTNTFQNGIYISNFGSSGITVNQAAGGVGAGLYMAGYDLGSANPIEVQSSTGATPFLLDRFGDITSEGYIKITSTTAGYPLVVQSNGINQFLLDINGNASIAGNFISSGETSAFGVKFTTSGAEPTCNSSNRNLMWVIQGASGVADQLQYCKQTTSGYSWSTITSSP